MLNETVSILKYLVSQKESEEILATYMKTVFLRKDVLDQLTDMLVIGATDAVKSDETLNTFVNFFLRVIHN